jgi:DNA-binding NarL/FixJ family response regulator
MSEKSTATLAAASRTLIKALGASETSDDFCMTVVHSLLQDQQAITCFIAILGNDSNVEVTGKYGFERGLFDRYTLSVWEPSGITAAMRSGEIQRIDSAEEYRRIFPSNRYSDQPGNGYIAIPFLTSNNAVGAIGFAFQGKLSEIDLPDELIDLIRLAAPFFAKSRDLHIPPISLQTLAGQNAVTLTDREERILLLMSQGNTNQEIGLEMHLSESSIRSASVGIFRALGVHSRKDAVAAARHLGLLAILPLAKVLSAVGPHLVDAA